jgi:broad specificity phosphatase PhoE
LFDLLLIELRHGARLDAANKNWHLTSATPYNPPLTYGGWLQSRSLGNRIASILQRRETEGQDQPYKPTDCNDATSPNDERLAHSAKHRKCKIIIHSSPFLRCVQTAIAIGAGIGQFRKTAIAATNRPHPVLHSGSPQVGASKASPQLSAIPEPEHLPIDLLNHSSTSPTKHLIAELRIDAFLGEWLSPDYFEKITPPPSSTLMVASAKAELLRPAPETIDIATPRKTSLGHFPGGWSRDRSPASSTEEDESGGLAQMATLSHSLPRRLHTVSHGHGSRIGVRDESQDTTSAGLFGEDEYLTYVPPTPTYAISNSDSIPAGYVAHAQNACVDVNYRWDSMRPPHDWGNGGEYGEEWSSMHKRFRNGLQRMIAWYEKHGTSVSATERPREDDEDADLDIVLILVTHGAGCNALIGALTNHPVLLDVGMASLTMAIRKSEGENGSPTLSHSPKIVRRGSIDLGIADQYSVELTASTEHLRAATNPMGTPSPRLERPFFEGVRRSSGSPFQEVPDSSSIRSGLADGLHRSASGSHGLRPYPMLPRSKLSLGLWGSSGTASTPGGVSESSDSDSMPNFDDAALPRKGRGGGLDDATGPSESSATKPLSPALGTAAHRGLWGSGLDNSPRRRWTASDH